MCRTRWERCLKLFSHTAHLYGRSELCVRWWCARCEDWLKLLSHVSHLYGFSPVCTRSWRVSSDKCRKDLWHTEHLYGLSGAEASNVGGDEALIAAPPPDVSPVEGCWGLAADEVGVAFPEPGLYVFSQMEHFIGLFPLPCEL